MRLWRWFHLIFGLYYRNKCRIFLSGVLGALIYSVESFRLVESEGNAWYGAFFIIIKGVSEEMEVVENRSACDGTCLVGGLLVGK